MFAVIKTGGHQYRVVPDDVLEVSKLPGDVGTIVQLPEVLVLGGDIPTLGTPTVAGASVAAEVLDHKRGPKVIAFTKRRRKNSRRKRGYRDEITVLRITEILPNNAKPSIRPRPRKATNDLQGSKFRKEFQGDELKRESAGSAPGDNSHGPAGARHTPAGSSKSQELPLAKQEQSRQDAVRQQREPISPAEDASKGKKEVWSLTSDQAVAFSTRLGAQNGTDRIAAMQELQKQDLTPAEAKHFAAKLISLLVSDDSSEAVKAAITLCQLVYPDRYKDVVEPHDLLARVREDLPKALHDRRVDYVTHLDAERLRDGWIRVHARLSNELPFMLDGQRTRLITPRWMKKAKAEDFTIIVSGPSVDSESVRFQKASPQKGDLGAVTVECKMDEGVAAALTVDFFVDNHRLTRETLSLKSVARP